ncbi:MAG: hypothetical protein HY020_25960 [Burkholderiales bacterium]|nr:hypothetical protein [Burkholderiales bacterium]
MQHLLRLALLSLPLNALAGEPPAIDAATWPLHSFRFSQNALACKLPSPDIDFGCLRIGELQIGTDWAGVTARFGEPWKREALPGGGVREVHLIDRDAGQRTFSYWVLESRGGKLVNAQLTGNHPPQDPATAPGFSGLRLGDTEAKVRELLGPRFKAAPVLEISGVLWNYAPFCFSIEIVDGRVYSLRVHDGSG